LFTYQGKIEKVLINLIDWIKVKPEHIMENENSIRKKVFIVECKDYKQVDMKLAELIIMLGGIEKFVKPDQRVVLKPNLLSAADPDKAVTTHPSVITAIGNILKKVTNIIVIAESPGSGYNYDKKVLEKTYKVCGIEDAANNAGIELNFDTSFETISFPAGRLVKRFEIITPIRQCDCYINLCKLKTHGLMYMSGAIKNIFGVIPGRSKPGYHSTMTNSALFAGVLLDLATLEPPKLTIVDAVVGMEGDGPFSGEPRPVGLLLASEDLLSLDIVLSEMMGIPADNNPLLVEARRRNMFPSNLDDVHIVGMDKKELRIDGFKLPASYSKQRKNDISRGGFLMGLVKRSYTVEPRIKKSNCTACGVCQKACPRDAIQIIDKCSVIDKKTCIRCYCCHEMCQYNAIELHKSFLYRMAKNRN
jgi:uncharacterized protein (DUF362 family)/NAD-dependent dihydropyrimidine dehydrogenase PreA subunit